MNTRCQLLLDLIISPPQSGHFRTTTSDMTRRTITRGRHAAALRRAFAQERPRLRNRQRAVFRLRPAALRARLERMIAVRDPNDANRAREAISGYLLGAAERVARSLQDQRGSREIREVRRPEPVGLSGRVEGITETEQSSDARRVGDEARDPPAQRLAADDEARRAELVNRLEPRCPEHGLPVGRS